MLIVYLHGFASNGGGYKSESLKKEFGSRHVVSPDLPLDPREVQKLIGSIVRNTKDYPIVFVGTSLGGFYANYFAQKYDCPAVVVNPATNPTKTLYQKLGTNVNFRTNEKFEWIQDYLDELGRMEQEVSGIHSGALVNLFVAKDDNIIDYKETLANYPYTAHSRVYDTGGHRLENAWPEIVAHIKSIIK